MKWILGNEIKAFCDALDALATQGDGRTSETAGQVEMLIAEASQACQSIPLVRHRFLSGAPIETAAGKLAHLLQTILEPRITGG